MGIKKWVEKNPQPQVCQECNEKDNCLKCRFLANKLELVDGENLSWDQMIKL